MNSIPPRPDRRALEALCLSLAIWGLTLVVFTSSAFGAPRATWAELPTWRLIDAVAGLLLMIPVYLVLRKSDRHPLRLQVALLIVGVSLSESLLDATVHNWLFSANPAASHLPIWRLTELNAIVYLPIYSLYGFALALLQSNRAVRERERQLAEAQSAAHQAQLAALRYQMNPHFLFNTLNAISTLIVTRRNEAAEAMMSKLADFLRASLSADPERFIPLQDELATVRAYLEIEAVRFGDRLAVEVACPAALADALAPSFLLQPLVENAIKYAVAPARRPVTISIEAAADGVDLVVTVADDGEQLERGAAHKGAGVGLRNVRERLAVLYGDRGVLQAAPCQGGYRARVRLPLRHAAAVAEAA